MRQYYSKEASILSTGLVKLQKKGVIWLFFSLSLANLLLLMEGLFYIYKKKLNLPVKALRGSNGISLRRKSSHVG